MIMFTSIITSMAFLGGTFFSLNYVPAALKYALYLLPLTHDSICLRASIMGQGTSYLSLFAIRNDWFSGALLWRGAGRSEEKDA